MVFFVVFLMAMFLPGAVAARAMALRGGGAALAVALSFSVLVLVFLAARAANLDVTGVSILLGLVYAALAAWGIRTWRREGAVMPKPATGVAGVLPALVLVCAALYAFWAGPYTEVPADAWWHIGEIRERLDALGRGDIGAITAPGRLLGDEGIFSYTIIAYFVDLARMDLEASFLYLSTAATVLFCAAVYSFSLFVFDRLAASSTVNHVIAAAAVFFFVTQFGVNVFSYVRYYVFAPTFFSYVVYLAAIVCFLNFIRRGGGQYRYLVLTAVFAVVAAVVHVQEAIFIVVFAGAVVLVEFLRVHGYSRGATVAGDADHGRRVAVLFGLCLCGYVVLHGYAYVALERQNPLRFAVLADIRHYLPFLQNLFVLQPTGQFYQVLTLWGVVVYVLFFAWIRRFIATPFLVAGMVIPFLTVFNPLFIDFFLRFASPRVVWRMCFMVPLPLLGAFFLVKGVERGIRGRGTAAKAGGLAVAAILLVLLLPIQTTYFVSPYSKIYTLAPVSAESDYRQWRDLLSFLGQVEESGIITDRVTGYVINGLTRHKYNGYKFYELYSSHIDRDSYSEERFQGPDGWKALVQTGPFEPKRPWLVVVNRRDGAPSETGRLSGHWPEDVLKVSAQYSDAFLQYVEGRPQIFKPIWSRDRITVYEVRT